MKIHMDTEYLICFSTHHDDVFPQDFLRIEILDILGKGANKTPRSIL